MNIWRSAKDFIRTIPDNMTKGVVIDPLLSIMIDLGCVKRLLFLFEKEMAGGRIRCRRTERKKGRMIPGVRRRYERK